MKLFRRGTAGRHSAGRKAASASGIETPPEGPTATGIVVAATPEGPAVSDRSDRSGPDSPALAAERRDPGDRLALKDRLGQLVGTALLAGPRPALLVVDLDGFGRVNQRYGSAVGDELLRITGARLAGAVGAGRSFRIGGDQFAAVLDSVTVDEASATAGRLLEVVAVPLEGPGISIRLSASVGVAMLGERTRVDGVLRDADVAMFRAKEAGGGRVEVYRRELDDWARARRRDVDSLAREVEDLRLENRMLTESLIIDPRTGLANAAAFEADHLQLHARRRRSEERYALLMADIDYFRDFNDCFGVAAGNQALQAVARTVRDTIRLGDRAYRYGGEEFAVLLPGADAREAVSAAERIRAKVQELAIAHPANPAGALTITIGVAEAGFRHPGPKDVLVEVNELLMEGKLAGRNRIVWPHPYADPAERERSGRRADGDGGR